MLTVRIEGLDKIQRSISELLNSKTPKAVAAGMRDTLGVGKQVLRDEVKRGLSIKKSSFPNVMTGVVQDANKTKMPLAAFFSKAGWIGAHITGAKIKGRSGNGVLIPINTKGGKRIGYRKWKQYIQMLASQGNLEFRKVKGKVLVYAENLKGKDAALSNAALRSHNRKVGADKYGRKRSNEIPIAIYVKSITLKKRIDFKSAASRSIVPKMASNIQSRLSALKL